VVLINNAELWAQKRFMDNELIKDCDKLELMITNWYILSQFIKHWEAFQQGFLFTKISGSKVVLRAINVV